MDSDERLWHITVTVAGPRREPAEIGAALEQLAALRPFMHGLSYDEDRAEVMFWEEAPTALDAASLAMRVWAEFRQEIGMPDWELIGFEILKRGQHLRRDEEWPYQVPVGFSPLG